MKRSVFGLVLVVAVMAAAVSLVQAQGGAATATLAGVVRDSNDAPVPGAAVTATYDATNSSLTTETNKQGLFSFPAATVGTWTLRATANGFKTSVVTNVRPVAGGRTSVPILLQAGNPTDVVTTRSNSDLSQVQTPQVTTSVTGDEMMRLPLKSREALTYVTFLPGVDTPLNIRDTTVMGLPQSTLNITLDGINIQNNVSKTTDGFFGIVKPNIGAVDSLTMSLATPLAGATAQGAVQIQLVTKSGTNQFGGSGYYAFRNTGLSANSYFNEQNQLSPNKANLNEFGINEGGPLGSKVFFFANYGEIHEETSVTRTATMLNSTAPSGLFSYNVGSGSTATVLAVNVLTLAGASGQINTVDPTIATLLATMQANASVTGTTKPNGTDPLTRLHSFQNPTTTVTRQPVVRIDANLARAHRLTGTYTWAHPKSDPDTLNNGDPSFPGFVNFATQSSNRQTGQVSLRSVIAPTVVNEFRVGGAWSDVNFAHDVTPGQFPAPLNSALTLPLITSPWVQTTQMGQRTNDWTIGDTVTWQLGKHGLDFGADFSQFNATLTENSVVPEIQLGLAALDPANAMFTTTNFPGASSAVLNNARDFYALLTGRVSSIQGTYGLNPASGVNVFGGTATQSARLNETGFFAQDNWRMGSRVTLTGGIRYEIQSPFTATSDGNATATLADICGVSGTGSGNFGRGCNLFRPGTLSGTAPQLTALSKGSPIFDTDDDNLAPNAGIVWRIGKQDGIFRTLFGDPDMAVLHAGYAVSYSRNGLADFTSVLAGNSNLSPSRTRDINGELALGGPLVLLRNPGQLGVCGATSINPATCAPAVRTYPFAVNGQDINIFDNALQVPKTKSYSVGLQRSLGRNTSVDVRYVGTRFENGWTTENWNELNVYESGFINEFRLAQSNLESNLAFGRGATFAYFGPGSSTSPLPQYLAFFNGQPQSAAGNAALYTSTRWTNATFVNRLARNAPNVAGALGDLWGDPTLRANALGPGAINPNQFVLNPDADEANVTRSVGQSEYDSIQIDVRRRLADGLQFTANYTYATRWDGILDSIHFDYYLARSTASVPQAFKTTWYYEIPFGRDRKYGKDTSGWVNGVIGGWNVSGTGRVQSGQLLRIGGVRLVGMTEVDLQREFKIRYASDGTVTTLPDDIILNTRRAFSVSATSADGYSSLGAPSGRYLAPATTEGCISVLPGECGEARYLTVTGPTVSRFDVGFNKAFGLGGRRSLQIEFDIFNLFNTRYFNPVLEAGSSATLNQVTGPFNGTSDQGARLGQILGRIRW